MLSLVGELDMANLAERVPAQRILSAFDNEIDRDRLYKFKLRNISVIVEKNAIVFKPEAEISPSNRRASDRVCAFSPSTRLIDQTFTQISS
jgi:hypothetical protein